MHILRGKAWPVVEYSCDQCGTTIGIQSISATIVNRDDDQLLKRLCVDCMKRAFRIHDDAELERKLFSRDKMHMRIPDPDPLKPDIEGTTISPSAMYDEDEIVKRLSDD